MNMLFHENISSKAEMVQWLDKRRPVDGNIRAAQQWSYASAVSHRKHHGTPEIALIFKIKI